MKASCVCQSCGGTFVINDEPRQFLEFACPSCGIVASQRASEDLGSALEDALVQLHLLRRTFSVKIEIDSDALPTDFDPDQR